MNRNAFAVASVDASFGQSGVRVFGQVEYRDVFVVFFAVSHRQRTQADVAFQNTTGFENRDTVLARVFKFGLKFEQFARRTVIFRQRS